MNRVKEKLCDNRATQLRRLEKWPFCNFPWSNRSACGSRKFEPNFIASPLEVGEGTIMCQDSSTVVSVLVAGLKIKTPNTIRCFYQKSKQAYVREVIKAARRQRREADRDRNGQSISQWLPLLLLRRRRTTVGRLFSFLFLFFGFAPTMCEIFTKLTCMVWFSRLMSRKNQGERRYARHIRWLVPIPMTFTKWAETIYG